MILDLIILKEQLQLDKKIKVVKKSQDLDKVSPV